MAYTAEDCALLLQTMAGYDPLDSTSVETPVPNYTAQLNQSLRGLRVGVPKEFFGPDLTAEMGTVIETAIEQLVALGAIIVAVNLPRTRLSIPAYYIIAPAEASTNLSRYDGVRYGYRCADPENLTDLYLRSRSEGFGAEVQRRIMVGTYALSEGYFDAYYRKAQQLRRLIKDDFTAAFSEVDVIVGPTTPSPAWELGGRSHDPVAMYLEDIYTLSVNLAGLPAMAIPCGQVNQLPVGLQLIGQYFDEARLLNIAHQYQSVTDWHQHFAPEVSA